MNGEHVEVVLSGVEAIQVWRAANPETVLDLSGADLHGVDGGEVEHSEVDLMGADLSGVNLSEEVILGVIRSRADLRSSDLRQANLVGTNVYGADLRGAYFGRTVLDRNVAEALHLDDAVHAEASFFTSDLLAIANVPEVFLRGIGVPEPVMDILPLLRGDPFYRHSTFISYSHVDNDFAERLHNDLQAAGVRVWKDDHDLPIGARTREVIFEQIQLRDKTLVVLSEDSLASRWVEAEEPDITVLFPIAIDGAAFTPKAAWAQLLKDSRHIFDFRNWEDPAVYKPGFERILRYLGPRP